MKPVARKTGLVVRELADEVVVYDQVRHEAHCLNSTAATIFRNADGQRSVSELAAVLGAQGAEADELVEMALGQLSEARLLETPVPPPAENALPRRDAMRRVGLGAAILLPLVTSILAPTPSEAAATCAEGAGACSGQSDGTPCTCTVPPCLGTCTGGTCSEGC